MQKMYNNLDEIIISINEHGICNTIRIDNEKKNISYNEISIIMGNKQFYDFLDNLLRIIRDWTKTENNTQVDSTIHIKITEKNKTYDYFIHDFPDNYDSFLDLIKIFT